MNFDALNFSPFIEMFGSRHNNWVLFLILNFVLSFGFGFVFLRPNISSCKSVLTIKRALFYCVFCFVFVSFVYHFSGLFFALCLGVFFLLAISDFHYLLTNFWLHVIFVGTALISVLFASYGADLTLFLMLGALALSGALAIVSIIGQIILKREVLGSGDVLFIFGLGLLSGFSTSLEVIFIGAVFGVFIFLISLIFLRRKVLEFPLITLIFFGFLFKIAFLFFEEKLKITDLVL